MNILPKLTSRSFIQEDTTAKLLLLGDKLNIFETYSAEELLIIKYSFYRIKMFSN